MPSIKSTQDYQNIFHWAETQKDGTIPAFALRENDPYEVSKLSFFLMKLNQLTASSSVSIWIQQRVCISTIMLIFPD